jgi:hypothetical protein
MRLRQRHKLVQGARVPKGNSNAFTHGRYSAVSSRRKGAALIRALACATEEAS